jgi:hypothetical protein
VVASAAAPAPATCTERAPHVLSRLTVLQGVQAGAASRSAIWRCIGASRRPANTRIDYVMPVGGGYFFAPPGAAGGSDWVGSGLFDNV